MEILHDLNSLASLRGPVYLAIGVFDGVHRGHQALISEAQADAAKTGGTAVVMTFEPHPMMFFQRAEPPLRLSSPRHKELLLARHGVTHLAVLPFEAARAAQTAEEFVQDLRTACRPLGGIVVGADWRFGKGRKGDVALLRQMGAFEVDGIPAVTIDGEVISSTSIRLAVARGDLKFAEKALGRPYAILGPVVPGQKLGQKLGFPTANIATDGFQLPPDGVYAATVRIGDKSFRGIANLGLRPTVARDASRVLEVHLLNFDGDLYGLEVEVAFLRFVRGEKKFGSLDELRSQIANDIASVK
ncbi:MAG: riboflavin biosynthesis protein RibF [Chthoniobacterales bacterium]|nr:riboflavin biosynthesis protein RibF [Chthoniobacterales bacterium]